MVNFPIASSMTRSMASMQFPRMPWGIPLGEAVGSVRLSRTHLLAISRF